MRFSCGSSLINLGLPSGLSFLTAIAKMLKGSENFTFSLGNFEGGGIWLEARAAPASGALVPPPSRIEGLPEVLGQVVDTNRRPCAFPAPALHATMPWTGHRWLVTAHTCQCLPACSFLQLTPLFCEVMAFLCPCCLLRRATLSPLPSLSPHQPSTNTILRLRCLAPASSWMSAAKPHAPSVLLLRPCNCLCFP